MTIQVPLCPVCSNPGRLHYRSLRDRNCGIAGSWDYRKCSVCHSLWMDPQPSENEIPGTYPGEGYFTHSPPHLNSEVTSGALAMLKQGILSESFGYPFPNERSSPSFWYSFGKRIAGFSLLSQRVGRMVRYIPYLNKGKLLEIGCGNGDFLTFLRQFGWQTMGIEPDPIAAKYALNLGLDIHIGSVFDHTLPSQAFDVIHANHVIEHLATPREFATRIFKALKPNGLFISISPNPGSLVSRFSGAHWYGLADVPRHLCLISLEGYRRLFAPSLFSVDLFTSHAFLFWMAQYSSRHGLLKSILAGSNHFQGPRLAFFIGLFLEHFFPFSGDEIVCLARRKAHVNETPADIEFSCGEMHP